MKKGIIKSLIMLIITLAYQSIITSAFAQSPQKISYQAAVRKADGSLLISPPEPALGVRISILQGSSSGTVVYSETHTAGTNANGIMSLEIGTGTVGIGPFTAINWKTGGPFFIKTETDPLGGAAYNIEGTTQLISIPYAFYATTAGNSFNGDYNFLINKPVLDGSETKINGGTLVQVSGSGTAVSPYVLNSSTAMGGFSHYLGQPYNGGIIFYLYKRTDGTEHALVVSLTESAPITQKNAISLVGASSYWDGATNTSLYSNSLAKDWVTALGYGWYLPALDELNLLWQNRFHANKGLASVGGTLLSNSSAIVGYWSSTEYDSSVGWYFDFYSGTSATLGIGSNKIVRAVRWMITTPTQMTTTVISAITDISASSGGNIVSDEGALVTARGVCWSTSPNPTTSNSFTTNGSGTGTFTSSLTGLTIGTTYYVRAWATNSAGTAYGNERSFMTAATIPVVTTTALSSLTQVSTISGGNVTNDRGAAVTARGVCWNTSPNPITANSKTTDGAGTGVFTSSITGLTTGTTYYARAYATNAVGTAYGNEISFTTLAVPSVTTTATAYTLNGNATSGGNVTNEGGVLVTTRGVCWNTTGSPTTANSKTTNGGGAGIFTSSITGLTLGTTYYVRAYATNSQGTTYGNQITITSLAVGDTFQGGIVAFLNGTGLHGLIASTSEISLSSGYSNVTTSAIPAASTTDGQTNTTAIIGQPGHSASAAKICDDYSNDGYTDWYLPARDELITLWNNRALIGGFTGAFSSCWSSTEVDAENAYRIISSTGPPADVAWKTNTYRVRAVRDF